MPVPTFNLTDPERPVALIVDASFDNDRFTIDTTTIDGQRVVVMQMKDGVRFLTPAETLALSRALLSRLAYVGFPSLHAQSGESIADRARAPRDADVYLTGDAL